MRSGVWNIWSIFLLCILQFAAADYSPQVSITKSDQPAKEIFYFDDSSSILVVRKHKLSISFDDGASYSEVKETKDVVVDKIKMDPFNNKRAFALSKSKTQYFTKDQGKTWSKIELDDKMNYVPRMSFNAKNNDLVLVQFYSESKSHDKLNSIHYITHDGFKSAPKKLPVGNGMCIFAKSTKDFTKGPDSRIYCSDNSVNSFGHIVESKLLYSDDFFKSNQEIKTHVAKSGSIIDLRVRLNFVVVVVQNDKFNNKSMVSLLISKDGETFNVADLQVRMAYGVMVFLDSSPLSLFISVMDYSNSMHRFSLSTLYSSDSTGLKFTKLLDRVRGGAVTKVQTIDGAWLASVAEEEDGSHEDKSILDLLIGGGYSKNIRTKYSFNNGKDWDLLEVEDNDCKVSDGCSLHLLSPTERDGEGEFVTGPTPGILLAVGNSGTSLSHDIQAMKTWVSRNGGATWSVAIDEPCLFSFGDLGNVILAIPYIGKEQMSTSNVYFSLDQGKTWEKNDLEFPIFPLAVTTTIDGTSRKFVLSGMFDKTPEDNTDYQFSEVMYSFDFSKAYDGKVCGDGDFEDVFARVNADKDPVCVYGHKEKFRRRKQSSKCFVNKLFEDIKVYDTPCDCSEIDFECGPAFTMSEKGACVPDPKSVARLCAAQKGKQINVPNKVLMEGNQCKFSKKSEKDFVTTTKLDCPSREEIQNPDGNTVFEGDVVSVLNKFEGELQMYNYFEEGDEYGGDNLIIKTTEHKAYISNNGGISFNKVPVHDKILAFYTGYVPGHVILVTNTKTIFISEDAGNSFRKVKAPSEHRPGKPASFHKTDREQFIWYSTEDCDDSLSCNPTAYITTDGGRSFDILHKEVTNCDFVGPHFKSVNDDNKDLIYCSYKKDGKTNLLLSKNKFKDFETIYENIVGYAITGVFVVVAGVDEKKEALKASVTLDGTVFAAADFPPDIKVDRQKAYTILGSQSEAIFMHVTVNDEFNHEFGSILKSNSNGTSYVLSLDKVNRNKVGYVDFDRIEGIEGLVISNTVDSMKDGKELKTQISHNDGAEWNYLVPPVIDSKGKKYDCTNKPLSECSLNLHGFTERADYRDTYSSSSAVGLLMGVGNVGKTLLSYEKASTFISRDGGITWKEIKEGVYMWEYGDRGTILVLVNSKDETDTLSYSLDEGDTWVDYKFAEKPIKVLDLATVPSDTSRKFLILGVEPDDSRTTLSYSVDFTKVNTRQCQLDLDNPETDDFEYWSPSHPNLPDNCLFGHESFYLRRAIGHNDCFIGSAPLKEGFKITKNCSCTRRDYECDYNYFRDNDHTCKLVKGLSPSSRKEEYCKKENAFEYFEPTGYRKIPLSTCSGGKEFDNWNVQPCPGKEKEFNQHYGKEVSGSKLFIVLIIPLFVFIFATWFVYDKGIRRNGGFKRLGQIRLDLDEDDFQPIENNDVDKVVNRVVRGGILIVAGTFAVFKTLRKIDKILFDKLTSSIFRRTPGTRNYVLVPDLDEEEELFGNFQDNYEDELEEGATNLNREETVEENLDDLNPSTETQPDARLFDIDDQSDEELSE
jgi:photosystem II stability/assembly factor-like uncharacterized protein